jgi:hypothetical protein
MDNLYFAIIVRQNISFLQNLHTFFCDNEFKIMLCMSNHVLLHQLD